MRQGAHDGRIRPAPLDAAPHAFNWAETELPEAVGEKRETAFEAGTCARHGEEPPVGPESGPDAGPGLVEIVIAFADPV